MFTTAGINALIYLDPLMRASMSSEALCQLEYATRWKSRNQDRFCDAYWNWNRERCAGSVFCLQDLYISPSVQYAEWHGAMSALDMLLLLSHLSHLLRSSALQWWVPPPGIYFRGQACQFLLLALGIPSMLFQWARRKQVVLRPNNVDQSARSWLKWWQSMIIKNDGDK